MQGVLIHADTVRCATLRHEVPLAVIDPFTYVEVDGRRVAVISVLEADRVAEVAPDIEIIDPYERANGTPRYKHRAWQPPFDESPLIKSVGKESFSYAQPMTLQGFLDRINSCSFIAILDDRSKKEVLSKLSDLVRTHPDLAGNERFEQPYVTEVYVYETV